MVGAADGVIEGNAGQVVHGLAADPALADLHGIVLDDFEPQAVLLLVQNIKRARVGVGHPAGFVHDHLQQPADAFLAGQGQADIRQVTDAAQLVFGVFPDLLDDLLQQPAEFFIAGNLGDRLFRCHGDRDKINRNGWVFR